MRLLRTLHVYLSMAAAGVMMLYAVSGFVLNHADWFDPQAARSTSEKRLSLPAEVAARADREEVLRHLRRDAGVRGAVSSFQVDDDAIRAVFRSPGRRCEIVISRPAGDAEMTTEWHGLPGVLSDLHEGEGVGSAWRRIMDAMAVLLAVSVLTGVIMLLTLPNRRRAGIIAAAAGAAVCALAVVL